MIEGFIRWGVVLGFGASSFACGGVDIEEETAASEGEEMNEMATLAADDEAMEPGELGQASAAWWGYSWNESSCYDPTGTDSVLAALAVATAQELGRWQPEDDFKESFGRLVLTPTGKARCADGQCWNTQALLDLQRDSARSVEVRPGVYVNPRTLRLRLTWNHDRQQDCLRSFWNGCRTPDHQFEFIAAEPGACDMNYWFEVRRPDGRLLGSSLDVLKKALVWVDIEDNSYIKFQNDGSTIAIDPTYGLNAGSATKSGSCSASCMKVSRANVAGQCCSCNGTKKYRRSAFNANAYLCR